MEGRTEVMEEGWTGGQMEGSFNTAALASRCVAAAGNLAVVGLHLTHLSGMSGN